MINLSSKEHSDPCKSALGKGLSFAPTNQCDEFDIHVSLQKFFRKLRIADFFRPTQPPRGSALTTPAPPIGREHTEQTPNEMDGHREQQKTHKVFKGKSSFMPPKNKNMFIETYCQLVQNDTEALLKRKGEYKVQNNMPVMERKALKELMDDPCLIVNM